MAKDRTKDLTQGTPWKVIAGFSLPVIGGNLFQLFYTLADSMIVGRTLGADALAAVGATATIAVSYTHLRAHETRHDLVCRLLLEKKKIFHLQRTTRRTTDC